MSRALRFWASALIAIGALQLYASIGPGYVLNFGNISADRQTGVTYSE
jgi:hypothetical protein